MMRLRRTLLGAAASLAVVALASGTAQAASLFETVAANPQLSTFASLIRKAGLDGQLGSQRDITLYAPTNAAFDALPHATYRRLTETSSQAEAAAVIRAHMVTWNSPIPTGTESAVTMTTLGGTQLGFQGTSGSTVRVNGQLIEQMNIRTDNGFLHVVGNVLPTR
jgi:uncharacterized surface protein with fasciclin (FAS1) repeats